MMKRAILAIKAGIRFVVSVLTSREWAFCYCLIGTVAQISHTYFLVESISSLSGGWRTAQATMLSIFISSSLLYFVAIADDEDTDASRRVHRTVTLFTIIEVTINVYYYARHILIDPLALDRSPNLVGYFDLAFALMMAVMIPITIKLYASTIRAQEWIEDIEHGRDATISGDLRVGIHPHTDSGPAPDIETVDLPGYASLRARIDELWKAMEQPASVQVTQEDIDAAMAPFVEGFRADLQRMVDEAPTAAVDEAAVDAMVQKVLKDKIGSLDDKLTEAFERNSGMFIKQFENKVKQIMNKGFTEVRTQPKGGES